MIKIGTLEIPLVAGFDVNIDYPKILAKNILRTKNGTGIMASRWEKLRVVISGSGWLPDGLDSIDENAQVDIHSTAWLSTASTSNIITIPRAFRIDEFTPRGTAIVNGDMVETPVVIAAQQATLTVVPGATQYHVLYCPIVTSFIALIDRKFDVKAHVWNWSIEAEEI